ncbi:hypothetical protein BJ912DRAFT_1057239 [Pholiota molesta]|nr:hypothetical protein BJ912DRAFT_1057239 [Pholiota molesta]
MLPRLAKEPSSTSTPLHRLRTLLLPRYRAFFTPPWPSRPLRRLPRRRRASLPHDLARRAPAHPPRPTPTRPARSGRCTAALVRLRRAEDGRAVEERRGRTQPLVAHPTPGPTCSAPAADGGGFLIGVGLRTVRGPSASAAHAFSPGAAGTRAARARRGAGSRRRTGAPRARGAGTHRARGVYVEARGEGRDEAALPRSRPEPSSSMSIVTAARRRARCTGIVFALRAGVSESVGGGGV